MLCKICNQWEATHKDHTCDKCHKNAVDEQIADFVFSVDRLTEKKRRSNKLLQDAKHQKAED